MSEKMLVCAICKTPIEHGLEIQVSESEHVHPCSCHDMYRDVKSRLTESAGSSTVEEIQMIM